MDSPKRKLVASAAAVTAAKARGLVKEPRPAVIKQPSAPGPAGKKHALSYERIGQILAVLRRFPAFHERRPLKIGIFNELAQLLDGTVSKVELGAVMGIWCRDGRYLHRIRLGEGRVNLDGKPCGEFPSEEHRKTAAALLAARDAKKKGGPR